jgi:aldose 1-epimerase
MMKNLSKAVLGMGVAIAMLSACDAAKDSVTTISGLNPASFDSTLQGKATKLFVLKNKAGMEVCITNYGARVVSIAVPDKDGKPQDVVLGYDNIAQYADTLHSPSDYGSSVGRYANRIAKAQFTIAGKTYKLRANDGKNCLHGGGNTGWMNKVYDAKQLNDSTLQFAIVSPDGDNGFPGTVKATATYMLKSDNTLDINFDATTDKETVINMTNHSYFNLNGDPSKVGTDMVLYVNADNFTPSDKFYIPTGEIKNVTGTPMDFRKAHAIQETIVDTTFDQIHNATGYDHNFCLNTYKNGKGDDTKVCASLYSPKTGILMEMFTNEPGVQVYTGNFQGTGITCKKGIKYPKHVSVCLESQKYPNTPNQPAWPTANVKPGQKYHSHVAYHFSIKK